MLRSFLVLAIARLRNVRSSSECDGWMPKLLARRPYKVAAVAVANKLARIAWALMVKGGVYDREVAATCSTNEIRRDRHRRRPRCNTMMNAKNR